MPLSWHHQKNENNIVLSIFRVVTKGENVAMRYPGSGRRAFIGQNLLNVNKYTSGQDVSRREPTSEIIAVLTAAVAAYFDQLGRGGTHLLLKGDVSPYLLIKEAKTEQTTAFWATYGKVRLMEARAGMNLIRRGRI